MPKHWREKNVVLRKDLLINFFEELYYRCRCCDSVVSTILYKHYSGLSKVKIKHLYKPIIKQNLSMPKHWREKIVVLRKDRLINFFEELYYRYDQGL